VRVYELYMRNGDVIRVEERPERSERAAITIDAHGHARVCRGTVHNFCDWDYVDVYPSGEWKSLRISTEVV